MCQQDLHSVKHRCITFEAMRSMLADMIEKIVEWYAEYKHLQNLNQSVTCEVVVEDVHTEFI